MAQYKWSTNGQMTVERVQMYKWIDTNGVQMHKCSTNGLHLYYCTNVVLEYKYTNGVQMDK